MRIDVPTLRCDRCHTTTKDTNEMINYRQVKYYHASGSGSDTWDFCPNCWTGFLDFCNKIG